MGNVLKNKLVQGSGFLVVATMAMNFLNYAFHAFLGRYLNLADFGLITFLNSLIYIMNFFLIALNTTVVHEVAYNNAKHGEVAGRTFLRRTRNKAIFVALVLFSLFLFAAPYARDMFQLPDTLSLLLISPIIITSTIAALYKGYLKGSFKFFLLGFLLIVDPAIRFVFAVLFILAGLQDLVYLTLPFSLLFSSFLTIFLVNYILVDHKNEETNEYVGEFPKGFFGAAFLTTLAGNAFLTFDIVLVKSYFSPEQAGTYALLALIGKSMYFFTSLVSGFIVPFTSRTQGSKKKKSEKIFYPILSLVTLISFGSVAALVLLGDTIIPMAFGEKARVILPYVFRYSTAIALYCIATSILQHHLAKKDYAFPIIAIVSSVFMGAGIIIHHESILSIVNILLLTAAINLALMLSLHVIGKYGVYIIRVLVDFVGLFIPFTKDRLKGTPGKRVLILNWRDTVHTFAGGAEEYLHQLAKRWVQQGYHVTWFCGNDGTSKRYEVLDGIEIIRRGGFYFVYFWAFLYYMFRFRGKYDIIIDSENGIPFFTPLYAKEKIYLVMHHVHRKVFFKYLKPPLSWFAAWLELTVMPWAYKNVQFITVSNSTKREIFENKLTEKEPILIHNGVDLAQFGPGEKHERPLVLYLGRLKQYKSVDVFIKAAKKVLEHIPQVEFVIAGEGEERDNLMKMVQDMKLELKITFTGRVTEDQKKELLQKAWLLVHPSLMEGWGIAIIEANACGTPVVAADVPGLRDSVKNPHTGYLLRHGDYEAFAEKICLLLENHRLRQEMSDYAIQWAKLYEWDESARKSIEVFEKYA